MWGRGGGQWLGGEGGGGDDAGFLMPSDFDDGYWVGAFGTSDGDGSVDGGRLGVEERGFVGGTEQSSVDVVTIAGCCLS